MSDILCCNQAIPYGPQHLQHERKFKSFLAWVRVQRTCSDINNFNVQAVLQTPAARVFQVVKQVNYGPLESKRYFVTLSDSTAHYHEITEHDLIDANYKKLNSFKNFKCTTHNKFIEINIYEKDPVNSHHWRADVARPAADIDL